MTPASSASKMRLSREMALSLSGERDGEAARKHGERALRESAICASHDAVAANDVGIAQQPLGHEVEMLDDVGRMRNEPRHQHVAGGQRHVLKSAVKRRIRSAADRHSPRREAPGFIIDIGERSVQGSQLVVGIVGEAEG